MLLHSIVTTLEKMGAAFGAKNHLAEHVGFGRASALIQHRRPTKWLRDAITGLLIPDPDSYMLVDAPELVHNVIPTVGRDFLHVQGYGTAGLVTNGLNYIALSDDSLTETTASTTLSSEIVLNGLTRAQGTVTHNTGTNTTTVDKTFTCSSNPQAAQKAALFALSSGGTMNHVLAFTERSLQVLDTLQITFTITLG